MDTSIKYDYNKLIGRITEMFGRQYLFAEHIGMGRSALSLKLNNVKRFKQDDVKKAANALNLTLEEIGEYFFNEMV